MRIVTVITRLVIGGASPPVILLATGLAQRGHESILVIGTPEPAEGTMEEEAIAAGASLERFPALRRNPHVAWDLKALCQLFLLFRRLQPDIVATHLSKAGALGRVAARLAGVPVIVHTYHGKGFDVFGRGWRRSVALNVERLLARFGSGNIVISPKQRDEFVRLRISRPGKLRVVRLGLNLESFVAASRLPGGLREELGLASSTSLVGVVGRLVTMKGQDVFLRAAAGIASSHPEARFVVAGDGEKRKAYERMAATLGIADRTSFLGWRRDVPTILASLDIVVLPTVMDFEGTPVAVIEALATSRAVVAADVGGVTEVVRHGETGLIVPPRDPAALGAAIARLLDDPDDRERLGRNGQRLVCEAYAPERMVQETERYFAELLQVRRSGRGTPLGGTPS